MIDRSWIGRDLGSFVVEVAPKEVRRFVDAIGEDRPIYRSLAAAQAAGFPWIPLPPTYPFSLMLDREDPFAFLRLLAIEQGRILHAEQRFEYHAPLWAGEPIALSEKVADIYDKKGGLLEFVVLDAVARRADGTLAVTQRRSLVVRHG
jgi:hydroxyacyl-ACP dehydratase HTD2-like protein with hotdog domain